MPFLDQLKFSFKTTAENLKLKNFKKKQKEMALCAGIRAWQSPKLQVICDQSPLIIPFYHTFKQTLVRSTYAVQCIFVIT